MKKLILITTLFVIIAKSYGQCYDTFATPTTDWRQYDGVKNKNNWNWTSTDLQTFVLKNGTSNYITITRYLPYYCPGFGTGGCNNANTQRYHNYTDPKAVDVQPEDGWELLLKNFGTTSQPVDDPYFVLYNRFTGRLKAFIMMVKENLAQNAEIKIGFVPIIDGGKRARATLSTAAAIVPMLDEFDSRDNFVSTNKYVQNSEYWIIADIVTHYDPCTCSEPDVNELPLIGFESFLINSMSVVLNINGTIKEQIITGSNSTGSSGANGTTSIHSLGDAWAARNDIKNAAKKGYDDWGKTATDILGYANKGSKFLHENIVDKWWKSEIEKNPSFALFPKDSQTVYFERFKKTTDAFKILAGVKKLEKLNNTTDFIKGMASAVPYVGAAVSLIDFFTAGGGTTQPSAVNRAPIVQNVTLTAIGSITNHIPGQLFTMNLPGYRNNNPVASTPYYNNTLGVLSLIDMPNFNYIEGGFQMSKPDFQILFNPFYVTGRDYDDQGYANGTKISKGGIDWGTPYVYPYVIYEKQYEKTELTVPELPVLWFNSNLRTQKATAASGFIGSDPDYTTDWKVRSYKLSDDLKYAVNPATKSRLVSMDASIILEYTISKSDTNILFDSSNTKYGEYSLPYVKRHPRNKADWIKLIQESGMEIEYISNWWKDTTMIRIRTQYHPINVLKNESVILWNGSLKPKSYLKLYSHLKRTDVTTSDTIVYIITYDISSKFFGGYQTGSGNAKISAISGNLSFRYWQCHPMYRYHGQPRQGQIDSMPELMDLWSFTYLKNYTVKFQPGSIYPHSIFDGIADYLEFNSGQTVSGYVLAKKIIINPGVIVAPNAIVHATESIEVKPPNIINPPADLFAAPYFTRQTKTIAQMHASNQDLNQLCNSTKYKNKSILANSPPPINPNAVDLTQKVDVNIFPNPNNGNFNISLANWDENEEVFIRLYDLVGKLVWENHFSGEYKNISVSNQNFKTGIYILEFSNSKNKKSEKIIISNN